MITENLLKDALNTYVDDRSEYFAQWTFDAPILVSSETSDKMRAVGLVLNKAIRHVCERLADEGIQGFTPWLAGTKRVFDIFNQREEHHLGSYRTDFVFDQTNTPRLIEISCRSALNGFFELAVFNQRSKTYSHPSGHTLDRVDLYDEFVPFLFDKMGGAHRVCLIKRDGKGGSARHYKCIFELAGFEVRDVHYRQIWQNRKFISNAFVISELDLESIVQLPNRELELLASANLINDFRTVLVAHDKRFFSLLSSEKVLRPILSPSEWETIAPHLVETRLFDSSAADFERLLREQFKWVVKYPTLGDSQQIFAGPEYQYDDWCSMLGKLDLDQFVLQEWIEQKTHHGTIDGEAYSDYVTGTLMYFDESFFGFGPFRASSHCVTNKVDDRKIFPLIIRASEQAVTTSNILAF